MSVHAASASAAADVGDFFIDAKVTQTRLGNKKAIRVHAIRVIGEGIGKANVTIRCRASKRNCRRLNRGRVKRIVRKDSKTWKNVNWVLTSRNGIAVKVGKRGKVGRFANIGPASADPSQLVYKRVGCIDRKAKTIACPEGASPQFAPGQQVSLQTETPATVPPPAATTPAGPVRKTIVVDNRVTNGMGMREDPTPVRLQTQPWIFCGTRGCNINGTERVSGGVYDAAVCQKFGERTTNGHDTNASDDANPERFESTRYYGVLLTNGVFGVVSETWIRAADRGGLGLPSC